MEYKLVETDSILKEIGTTVANAVKDGRKELNEKEEEFVIKMTKKMLKEYKTKFSEESS